MMRERREDAVAPQVARWLGALALLSAPLLSACEAPQPDQETTTITRPQTARTPIVLDRLQGSDQQLAGFIEPVVVGTDAYRIITLEEVPRGLALRAGERVLDARLISAHGELEAVVLGADFVLRHVTREGSAELDRDVLGPLSVEGRKVAYVRGDAPDLELAIASLDASGDIQTPASHLKPAWSPALSEDGTEVLFAATYEGRARLFRLDAQGELHVQRKGGQLPSSPRAPIWRGDRFVFENERGVMTLILSEDRIVDEIVEGTLSVDRVDEQGIHVEQGELEHLVPTTASEGGAR